MKKYFKFLSFVLLLAFTTGKTIAQNNTDEPTGLPGDNFDLQGALQMFQKATSPEDFEKLLNTADNSVNNLDLNEDGETDYVKVIDKSDNEVHAFVLQVPVSETENQDIAVIELEKTGNETATIQIVGDEDIYGEQVISEPDGGTADNSIIQDWSNMNVAHSGPYYSPESVSGVIVNVWFWPSVRFVFAPAYRPWASPWRWRHYPIWWHTWKPLAWNTWHPHRMVYHRNFVIVRTNRINRAHAFYTPFRTTSVTVRTKHATVVNNYRITHRTTTVTGPRGHSATRNTTTVHGSKGKVKVKKTRVRRH